MAPLCPLSSLTHFLNNPVKSIQSFKKSTPTLIGICFPIPLVLILIYFLLHGFRTKQDIFESTPLVISAPLSFNHPWHENTKTNLIHLVVYYPEELTVTFCIAALDINIRV